MRSCSWPNSGPQLLREPVTTYSDVHFILLKWIHFEVLVADDIGPELDDFQGVYLDNGSDLCQISFLSFGLGVSFALSVCLCRH